MNRLIIDPISHGVIVTDGGNKKIWAIGSEGEKKSIQYRPWRKNLDLIQVLFMNFVFFSMEYWIFNNRCIDYFTFWLLNISCS
jgi:hypothetical protein